ncbi:MAG: hypothetical protein K0U38_02775 [Epsilonproteobacteria bacterium]|nr:hypothetical protein [Campylobacterota bacterium]
MKQSIAMLIISLFFMSGCTQIITAPIAVAGSVAGAAIDVTAAGVRAIAGSDDEDEKDD